MNTTTEINTSNRYTIEATLQEQGHDAIAQVFRQLCDEAEAVNKSIADMEKIVADNKAQWGKTNHLFYGASTVSNAARFEQAYAKYQTLEKMFCGLCHMARIESSLVNGFVTVAREAK
jgi:acyl-homoserine lactone acylase PvdQ